MDKLNKIIESYSSELKLLLVCCGSKRWKAEDLLPGIDWELFLNWMKKHRITPELYRFIKTFPNYFPDRVLNKIEKSQNQITIRALRLTAELKRLGKILDENKIPWFTMKGPALAEIITNNISGRDYRDIDIYTNLNSYVLIHDLLSNENFQYLHKISSKSLHKVNHNAEYLYVKKEGKVKIEIHWQLFANKHLLPISLNEYLSKKDIFDNNGIKIPNNYFHYSYIVMHGTIHQWSELQWLLDVKKFHKILVNNNVELLEKNLLTHNENVVTLWNGLNQLLFYNSQIEFNKVQSSLIKSCLLSINRNNLSKTNKLRKTLFLKNISDSKEYKNELIRLRLKRVFSNPSARKEY